MRCEVQPQHPLGVRLQRINLARRPSPCLLVAVCVAPASAVLFCVAPRAPLCHDLHCFSPLVPPLLYSPCTATTPCLTPVHMHSCTHTRYALQVPKAVDTNGAGDTFATMFMLALMRGDPAPGNTASWAASRAVMQPQTCKPRCAPLLVTEPGGVPPIGPWERVQLAVRPLLAQAAAVVARGVATLSAALPQQQAWLIEQGARQLQGWLDGVLVGRGVGCTGGGGVCVGM